MMGKPITMDQLRQDVGIMVEKITKVIAVFRSCHLRIEEYVCLKVLAMVAEEGMYYIITVSPEANLLYKVSQIQLCCRAQFFLKGIIFLGKKKKNKDFSNQNRTISTLFSAFLS